VRALKGLTLIEVLIAMTVFAVLMMVVTQSLLPLFGLTRESRLQLDANQQAQEIIEAIRSAWLDVAQYEKTCAPIHLPSGATVRVQALNKQAQPVNSLSFTTNCASAVPDSSTIPTKRVTVTIKDARGKTRARLTLDIRRP